MLPCTEDSWQKRKRRLVKRLRRIGERSRKRRLKRWLKENSRKRRRNKL
jgi:hypothetical protein